VSEKRSSVVGNLGRKRQTSPHRKYAGRREALLSKQTVEVYFSDVKHACGPADDFQRAKTQSLNSKAARAGEVNRFSNKDPK